MRSSGLKSSFGIRAEGGVTIAIATAMAVGLLAVTGCGDDSGSGPATTEFSERRKAMDARLANKKQAPAAQPAPASSVETTVGGVGLVAGTFRYDPEGKRDPFRSFLFERPENMPELARGPLEQFDVSQLSLVAVVWDVGTARALIQDPSGMSFIIARGTKVGKNSGRVLRIGDSSVVVKETYVDYRGKETTRDVEMRIFKSEGG